MGNHRGLPLQDGTTKIDVRFQDETVWLTQKLLDLSKDIRNELPEIKGFSERNLKRMIRFFREYPNLVAIMPRLVARMDDSLILQQPVTKKEVIK